MEVMRKRFEQVEKDYIKKMSEMEKNIYRSPLIEDLNEIPLTLPPPSLFGNFLIIRTDRCMEELCLVLYTSIRVSWDLIAQLD